MGHFFTLHSDSMHAIARRCLHFNNWGCATSRAFREVALHRRLHRRLYTAGGRIFSFRTVQSFTRTSPLSPMAYARKLLQRQSSGDATNPRVTGFRCMYRSFSTRLRAVQTLKS